ncbi:cofactor assembly of complex C subunit B [soil metagenome]
MVIGLVFFIRASTKDRIEVMQFGSQQSPEALQQAVIKYFRLRAYQPVAESADASSSGETAKDPTATDPTATDPATSNPTTLVGMVSPSIFMAIFLSLLAAVGFACLSLIAATLFPSWGGRLIGLVAASPLAGVFYWRKSSRPEVVTLKVEPEASQGCLSKLTVKGHRDEIAELQSAFTRPELNAWAGLKKWEGAE